MKPHAVIKRAQGELFKQRMTGLVSECFSLQAKGRFEGSQQRNLGRGNPHPRNGMA
jgi:hypothetical protein